MAHLREDRCAVLTNPISLEATMPRGRTGSDKPKSEPKKRGKASRSTRNSPLTAAVAAPRPDPDTHRGVQDLTRQQYESSLHLQAGVRAQIEAGQVPASVMREMSGLSRSIVVLAAELRQQENFYAKRGGEVTDDLAATLVIEWLSEAAPSVRRRIREAIEEMDGSSTLLG